MSDFQNYGEYVEELGRLYKEISKQNLDLYVVRLGDSMEGSSSLFALSPKEREIDESGSIKLSSEDLLYLEGKLDKKYLKAIKEWKNRERVRVNKFIQPEREDYGNFLPALEEILKGGAGSIAYQYTDWC